MLDLEVKDLFEWFENNKTDGLCYNVVSRRYCLLGNPQTRKNFPKYICTTFYVNKQPEITNNLNFLTCVGFWFAYNRKPFCYCEDALYQLKDEISVISIKIGNKWISNTNEWLKPMIAYWIDPEGAKYTDYGKSIQPTISLRTTLCSLDDDAGRPLSDRNISRKFISDYYKAAFENDEEKLKEIINYVKSWYDKMYLNGYEFKIQQIDVKKEWY